MIQKATLIISFSILFSNCFSQTLPFDSARFSPDGKYALIYDHQSRNCALENYWALYEQGLNKVKQERIIIYNDSIYMIDTTWTKRNCDIFCPFSGEYPGDTVYYNPCLIYQESLKEFVKSYNLTEKGFENTDGLLFRLDTISKTSKWISNWSIDNPTDSLFIPSYTLKLNSFLRGVIIQEDTFNIVKKCQRDIYTEINEIYSQLYCSNLYYSKNNNALFLKSDIVACSYGGAYGPDSCDRCSGSTIEYFNEILIQLLFNKP